VPVVAAGALAQILEAVAQVVAVLEPRTLQVIRALQILVVAVVDVAEEIRELAVQAALA
jgi:hypothetical protein